MSPFSDFSTHQIILIVTHKNPAASSVIFKEKKTPVIELFLSKHPRLKFQVLFHSSFQSAHLLSMLKVWLPQRMWLITTLLSWRLGSFSPPEIPPNHSHPLLLSHPTMVPSKKYTCPHQCGCEYSTNKKNDLSKHLLTGTKHCQCTPQCSFYNNVAKHQVRIKTPQTFATKQVEWQKSSPGPDPSTLNLNLLCILNPTQRVQSHDDMDFNVSWLTASDIPITKVKEVLTCPGLQGYIFSDPENKNAVWIYEWVGYIHFTLSCESCNLCHCAQAYVMFFCFQEEH